MCAEGRSRLRLNFGSSRSVLSASAAALSSQTESRDMGLPTSTSFPSFPTLQHQQIPGSILANLHQKTQL